MKRIRRSVFATGLLLGCAWSAAPAFAQVVDNGDVRNVPASQRPHPEYDPLGVHLGAFMVKPSVTFTGETTDNVFATADNRQSDLVFTIAPYVTAESTWSRHALRLYGGLNDVRHQDDSGDDHTDGFAGADARVDIYHDASLSFGGDYHDLHESRYAAQTPSSTTELVHYTDTHGYVLAAKTLDRFRLSLRGDFSHVDYDDVTDPTAPSGLIDQDFRDRDETVGTARVEYALTPDTSVLAQASFNSHDYDHGDPARFSSNGQEYLVGAATNLTHVLRGELDVGYATQDYDNPAIGTVSGLAVHGKADWFVTSLTTVSFSASRSVQDNGVSGSSFVTTEGVHIDHELMRNVILSGGVQDSQADYKGIDRNDNWLDADIGATYYMNRHVGLGARYYYSDYQSDGLARAGDYTVNRFAVSLTLKM